MQKAKVKLPDLKEEQKLWQQGYDFVVGLDEAGRGPLAGPVVACAVCAIFSSPPQTRGGNYFILYSIQQSPRQP